MNDCNYKYNELSGMFEESEISSLNCDRLRRGNNRHRWNDAREC